MKLIAFEWKKLFNVRYMWLFLAVFLAVNGYLSFYTAQKSQLDGITNREIQDFYELYFENSQEMYAYYQELLQLSPPMQDPTMAGEETEDEKSQRYAPEGYTDLQLFTQLFQSIAEANSYPDRIDQVIDAAEKNKVELRVMGISEDSYNYKLQDKIIDVYGNLKHTVRIGVEHSYGWAEYFGYSAQNIFLFISVILLVIIVMSVDRTSDMLPIIHCTAKGKVDTFCAKIVILFTGITLLVLTFSLSSFAIMGIQHGFSSSANAIQSVQGFEYCQYALSIGEYHVLSLVVRTVAFLTFGAFLTVVTVLIQNNVIAFALGILTYGLHFLMNSITYINGDHIFKNLNLIAVTDVKPLFVRLRSFNCWNRVWVYVPMMICLFVFLIVALFAIGGLLYVKRRTNPYVFSLDRRMSFFKRALTCTKSSVKSKLVFEIKCTNLYKSELQKLLLSSGMMFLIILLTILKIVYAAHNFERNDSPVEQVYYKYMTRLEGEITEEKLAFLEGEREEIDEILNLAAIKQNAFINGDISVADYSKYLESYSYAKSKDGYLELIEQKRDDLMEVLDSGRDAWFVYDTGWSQLLNSGVDYFLLVALTVVFCSSFAIEYKSQDVSDGFIRILKATPCGRQKTFRAKIAMVVVLSFGLCVFYNLIDMFFVIKNFDLPAAVAPLISISQFVYVDSNISIYQYLMVFYGVRVAFGTILTLIVAACSCLLKRGVPTLLTVSSMVVVPSVLAYIGFSFADTFNYLRFLDGTQLCVSSFATDWFGTDFGLLWVTFLVALIIALFLLSKAYRTFTR